jgi:hypothetical protein
MAPAARYSVSTANQPVKTPNGGILGQHIARISLAVLNQKRPRRLGRRQKFPM